MFAHLDYVPFILYFQMEKNCIWKVGYNRTILLLGEITEVKL